MIPCHPTIGVVENFREGFGCDNRWPLYNIAVEAHVPPSDKKRNSQASEIPHFGANYCIANDLEKRADPDNGAFHVERKMCYRMHCTEVLERAHRLGFSRQHPTADGSDPQPESDPVLLGSEVFPSTSLSPTFSQNFI
ncbi:unnamed protein product [Nippostrongylus brasiliensis]|uniref:Uncharacterized protein n=1 Tax=Nippostrongylus brasiliensis TaxID=27835 RepID=A0A0N4XUT6_NIPBR|nr:unnamed protein product [Nippostrongylus brasiliensis]